jgi:hypothetical protein
MHKESYCLLAECRVFPREPEESMPNVIDLLAGHRQAAIAKSSQTHETFKVQDGRRD